ncbi:replication-relaxation family protein [Rossellomorea aquimaris]|uniref:replication-relaxation family protein n=1 Tax=Rossellomorea aquimaris TaxID=189382 RepID=UPI0039906854
MFGANRKGVYLDHNDLKILKLIYTQRIVSTSQVHYYSFALSGMKLDTVQKKLKRWSGYKVVKQHHYRVGQVGLGYNYYTLGSNGIDILISEGVIREEDRKKLNLNRKFSNLDHTIAIQEVAVGCLSMFVNEDRFNIESINPYIHPFFVDSGNEKLIPDWIIKRENIYLNIEIDTGSETTSEIKQKIRRYVNLSKENPNNKYYVLFSVIDHSILTRKIYSADRSKRVSSLKYSIAEVEGVDVKNLEVYVCQLSRSFLTAFELINGNYPGNQDLIINSYLEGMREYYNHTIDFETDNECTQDLVHNIKLFRPDKFKGEYKTLDYKVIKIVVLEPGNVRSFKLINEILKSEQDTRIVGLYDCEQQVIWDVFGKIVPRLVLMGAREWKQGDYHYYTQKSPFILNRVTVKPRY